MKNRDPEHRQINVSMQFTEVQEITSSRKQSGYFKFHLVGPRYKIAVIPIISRATLTAESFFVSYRS